MGKTKIKTLEETEIKTPEVMARGDILTGDSQRGVTQAEIVGGAEERSRASTAASETSEDAREKPERPASPAKRGEQDPLATKQKKAKVSKRAQKKTAANRKIRSKKYLEKIELVERNKRYPLKEAIELSQKVSYSSFSGTVEAHLNTAVKNIKGSVSLPYLAGKKLTILAFGKDAAKAGADLVGSDETISQIEKGKVNADVVVSTPEWMPKLARVAKVLGPKGLMPSPKNETVTENLTRVISELRGGKTEFKTENNGQVIHLAIGKVNQDPEEIAANIKILYNTIGRSKIRKLTLSPSMGPGVKVDLGSI
ncbi:MAG: hypothetical protein Q7S44_02820 [bacterium]|nr:hypothetical protein [bacterium]